MIIRKNSLFWLSLVVIFFSIYILANQYNYRLIKVNEFRGFKVGQDEPISFMEQYGINEGAFFMYLIDDQLDILERLNKVSAIDEDVEPYGKLVVESGGHILATLGGKIGLHFNIRPIFIVPWKQVLRLKKLSPRGSGFDVSLLVVTNRAGQIIGLYKNARPKHIKKVLLDLGFAKSASI